MGDVTKWSSQNLDEVSDILKKTYDGIESSTDTLEKSLEPLLETWEGGAKEAYFEAKTQWTAAQSELNDIIQQLAGAIQDVKGGFEGTEQSNTQLFG
jgi:WXG100 family type VII secretion target